MPQVLARTTLLSLLAVISLLLLVATTGGAAGYTMTVSDTIDVPERTVTLEGDEYQVDQTAEVDVGESIEVSVDAPDGERSYVYLYNADRDRMDVATGFGSYDDSFATDQLAPGTYLVAYYYDGSYEKLVPVVVNGYDVEVDHAGTTTAGDNYDVSATVTPTDSTGQPATVEVAIWNQDHQETVELAHQGDGEYTGTASLDGFAAGDYNVHGAARSDEELRDGRDELLALQSAQPLTVEASSNDGTEETTTGGTTGGTQTTSAPTTSDGTTTTPTTTATPTPGTPVTTTTPPERPTTDRSPTPTTPTDDGAVLTPNQTTATTAAPTQTETQAPLSPTLTVLAVLLSSLLFARRR